MIEGYDWSNEAINNLLYDLERSTDWGAINHGGRKDLLEKYEEELQKIRNMINI